MGLSNFDRWLTTDLNEAFDGYVESVCYAISEEFFNKHEQWVMGDGINKYLNKVYYKGLKPKQAAKLIERTYNIYLNK